MVLCLPHLDYFSADLKRVRSDGENMSAQAEREKQALKQTLHAAQLEAQQALRKAISEHQEETERLVSEKVRSVCGSQLPEALPDVLTFWMNLINPCLAALLHRKWCGRAC